MPSRISMMLARAGWINPAKYGAIDPRIRQRYDTSIPPYAQGARLRAIAYGSMFIHPNDSPVPSQFNQAYTQPLQQFYQTNTFNAPAGDVSPGRRLAQPYAKAASSKSPIPASMPWEV